MANRENNLERTSILDELYSHLDRVEYLLKRLSPGDLAAVVVLTRMHVMMIDVLNA
jgi:hypothetical protein